MGKMLRKPLSLIRSHLFVQYRKCFISAISYMLSNVYTNSYTLLQTPSCFAVKGSPVTVNLVVSKLMLQAFCLTVLVIPRWTFCLQNYTSRHTEFSLCQEIKTTSASHRLQNTSYSNAWTILRCRDVDYSIFLRHFLMPRNNDIPAKNYQNTSFTNTWNRNNIIHV
jgi:hypothetical protein